MQDCCRVVGMVASLDCVVPGEHCVLSRGPARMDWDRDWREAVREPHSWVLFNGVQGACTALQRGGLGRG